MWGAEEVNDKRDDEPDRGSDRRESSATLSSPDPQGIGTAGRAWGGGAQGGSVASRKAESLRWMTEELGSAGIDVGSGVGGVRVLRCTRGRLGVLREMDSV